MNLILYLIVVALTGLFVGALARLLLPGRDPMTITQTMLVGIAGSLAAGLLALLVFDDKRGGGLLLSLVFSVAIVYLIRRVRRRREPPRFGGPGRTGTFGHR